MATSLQNTHENFFYNSMLASALIQLLPGADRPIMKRWLHKIRQVEEIQTRNDYMWFMLLMLQRKRKTRPFTKGPPCGKLPALHDVLAPKIYEEILNASDHNVSCFERESKNGTAELKQKIPSSHPSEFFENQPIPKDGIICYMAAFSDQGF